MTASCDTLHHQDGVDVDVSSVTTNDQVWHRRRFADVVAVLTSNVRPGPIAVVVALANGDTQSIYRHDGGLVRVNR